VSDLKCATCNVYKSWGDFAPSAPLWPERRHSCRPCERTRVQIARHGLTAAQRQLVADTQGGCRICGHDEPGPKGWVIDHDRSCCPSDKSCPKCRRGVLCLWCNMSLGSAFDRPQILRAAAEYIEAARSCVWHQPIACAPRLCGQQEQVA
jgi:recombination endonuclease VII